MTDLARLVVEGEISGMRQVEAELDDVANAARKVSTSTESMQKKMSMTGRASGLLGGAFSRLSGNTRNMRGIIQNTSFQLQDIIVQLEMGIPLTRTLAQQLPQLFGGFGALGAVLGVVAGAFFTVLAVMGRTGEQVDDLEKSMDKLKSSMSEFGDMVTLASVPVGEMTDKLGVMDSSLLAIVKTLERYRREDALSDLRREFAAFKEDVSDVGGDYGGGLFNAFEVERYTIFSKATRDKVLVLQALMSALAENDYTPEIRLEGLERSLALAEEIANKNGVVSETEDAIIRGLNERILLVRELIELENKPIRDNTEERRRRSVALYEQQLEQERTLRQNIAEYTRARVASEQKYRDAVKTAFDYVRRQYSQYSAGRGAGERAIVDAAAAAWNRYYTTIQAGHAQVLKEAEALQDEMLAAWRAGKNLGELSMDKGVNAAALAAKALSRELEISLAAAQSIVDLGGGAGGGRGTIIPTATDSYIRSTGGEFIDFDSSDGGVGGGAASSSGPTAMERLLQEQEQRETLLGLFGKERDLQREIFDIEQTLGDERAKYSDEYIAQLAQQSIAMTELEQAQLRALENTQALADTIESSMADAFLSMVDGTKTAAEAFRGMALEIIKQLYKILVVQQIVGSFDAGTGTGSGIVGAIMGGLSGIVGGGRADGGPVLGGTTYMVGERGPELFTPVQNGVITPNKSLVGSVNKKTENNMNVTQNVTIQAMGDGDIDRVLAKRMPQLRNMVISTIREEQRRGAFA